MSSYARRAAEIFPAPSVRYAEHAAGQGRDELVGRHRFDRDWDSLAARLAEGGR